MIMSNRNVLMSNRNLAFLASMITILNKKLLLEPAGPAGNSHGFLYMDHQHLGFAASGSSARGHEAAPTVGMLLTHIMQNDF